MKLARPSFAAARRGLTLIELMVALLILALIAGAALTATEGLVEQSRFDATVRTVENVERAIVGSTLDRDPLGRPWIQGFVADIGRAPEIAVVHADPADTRADALSELWLPYALEPLALQSPPGDLEVRLLAGWRGPYVTLPLGAPRLSDGWGRSLFASRADDTPADDLGEEITQFGSLGDDDLIGGSGYDSDLRVTLERTVAPIQPPRHVGAVPIRVSVADTGAGGFVVVRVYGPVDGDVRTLQNGEFVAPVAASTSPVLLHNFARVPIGARVLRAYLTDTQPATPDEPIDASSGLRSAITPILVVAGGIQEVELTLP